MPLSGSNAQVIACWPDMILRMEAALVPYLYPPTYANSLDGLVGVRQYIATLPRYPVSVAVISGSAYAAGTFP